jgi:hypothetical protein
LTNCLYRPCQATSGTDPVLPQDGLSWLWMSPDRISRLHSLVRPRGLFLGADSSGRAPRAGLVQDAASASARSAGSSWTRRSTALCLSPVKQCAVSFRSHPDQQRSCCDDQLNPPLRLNEDIVSAARSTGSSANLRVSVCHPSTLRMVIRPAASSAQNKMAAVSAKGSTVWVLIRCLDSSWSPSISLAPNAEGVS